MTAQEPDIDLDVHVYVTEQDRHDLLVSDVVRGLTSTPKSIPPIWFYDERGSELFEEITQLPEYYPTRTERSILERSAPAIVEIAKADTLVELGSGSSVKTRLLLDAMAEQGTLTRFVPFDVSEALLRSSAAEISRAYCIPVSAVVGDFGRHLSKIPRVGRRLVIFLGGTIGNLTPVQRHRFLVDLEATMDSSDWLLLGTDLEKDIGRLIAAYDDAAGVTAEFNKNVLAVMDSELGADFDLDAFQHVARWNDIERRIEMWLRSSRFQTVTVGKIGLSVEFDENEEMLTEISSKFTTERVREELKAANFVVEETFTDEHGDFLLTLAHPYC